jgi:hypothetical protein
MRGGDVLMSRLNVLLRDLRREDGWSVAELTVTAFIAGIVLVFLAGFLINTFKTGIFTEGQATTINDARNAMLAMEKELRGADSITWCTPTGSCLEIGAQTAQGGFRTVRYRHTGTELQRQQYDADTSTWSELQLIINRVVNPDDEPVFACDTQSTLLRVNVDLQIEPTPQSDPNYNVHTSIRPRNFPSKSSCPS